MDAVNFYLQHNRSELKDITVPQLVEQFYKAQEQKIGTKNRNLFTIRHHLNRISKAFSCKFREVSTQQLDDYISKIGNCGRTKVNHRRTLLAMWSWAQDRGYAPAGKTVAQATLTPKVSMKNPGIITPEDMRSMLQKCDDALLPMLVLGGFAGIRSAEIARLKWEDFNWDDNVIVLSSEITKRQRRRMVPITPQIRALLERFRPLTGNVLTVDPYKELPKLTDQWVHNGLRHSYISYAMAKHKNAAMIAEFCGNSETEVQRSYKALVTEKQATEWFELEK
jgi:integrase